MPGLLRHLAAGAAAILLGTLAEPVSRFVASVLPYEADDLVVLPTGIIGGLCALIGAWQHAHRWTLVAGLAGVWTGVLLSVDWSARGHGELFTPEGVLVVGCIALSVLFVAGYGIGAVVGARIWPPPIRVSPSDARIWSPPIQVAPSDALRCAGCGTPVYGPWLNRSKGGYVCRRCGAITPAPTAPAEASETSSGTATSQG